MKNPLDQIIKFFSPQRALSRERARMAIRSYEGAAMGRRASSWNARNLSANSEIGNGMSVLRDRARDLVRNTPHATRVLDIIVSHTVGTGIKPVPHTGSTALDKRVLELWVSWQKSCDVSRTMSFGAMQALAIRSMVESGEVVLRMVDVEPKKGSSSIPLRLQMLEADFIDQSRDGMYGNGYSALGVTPNTLVSRLGVGLGEFDERTGLWLLPYHPGETSLSTSTTKSFVSRFYSRDDLIHLYRPQRPGQVRGVTWFAPVLTTMRDLTDFLDAVNVKARVEACFSGFVTNSDDSQPLLDADPIYSTPDQTVSTMEPGMIKELRQGQEIKFAQPTTSTQVEPMILFGLMAMATGLGITYDQLSGDLRQANYSSLRAGKLDFRRLIETLQDHVIIPGLMQPVWERFISRAIIAGELKDRSKGYPCEWVTPGWDAVNPKFDYDAEQHVVRSGRMSPQAYIAEWGNDWRDVIDQWAEFNAYCDEKGVVLDIDARNRTRSGSAQPLPAGGAPGQEPPVDESGNPIEPVDEQQQRDNRVIPFARPRR